MNKEEKIIKALAENELPDEELQNVSGGGEIRTDTYGGITKMKCDFCGESPAWAGDYMGVTLDCPCCGRHEFHGDYWVLHQ